MGVSEGVILPVGANHLPRIRIFEPHRYRLLRLAGMDIQGPCLIWDR